MRILEYLYTRDQPGGRQDIGRKDEGCRLCGLSAEEGSFRDDAHVIPRFLGKPNLVTRNECDVCNHTVGETIDADLASFLHPILTIGRIPKRRGSTRKLKSHDKKSSIVSSLDKTELTLSAPTDEESTLFHIDEEGRLVINGQVDAFKPAGIARSLARLGLLSINSSRVGEYRHLAPWILGEKETPPLSVYFFHVGGDGDNRCGLSFDRIGEDEYQIDLVTLFVPWFALMFEMPDLRWHQDYEPDAELILGRIQNRGPVSTAYKMPIEGEERVVGGHKFVVS